MIRAIAEQWGARWCPAPSLVVLVVTVVVPSSIAGSAVVVLVVTVVMSALSLVVLVLGLPGRAAKEGAALGTRHITDTPLVFKRCF